MVAKRARHEPSPPGGGHTSFFAGATRSNWSDDDLEAIAHYADAGQVRRRIVSWTLVGIAVQKNWLRRMPYARPKKTPDSSTAHAGTDR